jgi:hypothetical protein
MNHTITALKMHRRPKAEFSHGLDQGRAAGARGGKQ